jgi:hypothetical protein
LARRVVACGTVGVGRGTGHPVARLKAAERRNLCIAGLWQQGSVDQPKLDSLWSVKRRLLAGTVGSVKGKRLRLVPEKGCAALKRPG